MGDWSLLDNWSTPVFISGYPSNANVERFVDPDYAEELRSQESS